MNDFNLHTLTATSTVLLIGVSLVAGIFVSYISALMLWLTPVQRIAAFITGFALMCTLAITQIYQPPDQWRDMMMLRSLPLLVSFIYFLPTIAAVAIECKLFRSVFVVNLFFGWTLIGWIAAMLMVLRPEERDVYSDLNYRFTPFGAVPNARTAYGADQTASPTRTTSLRYVPALRREL